MITKQELIDFEDDIASLYKGGKIKAPIHLSRGNEDQLIRIFQNVGEKDYVFSTWRSHYHALCHNIPRELIKKKILDGHSICLNFPEYNFYSSAIVGGILPIATGVAWALKNEKKRSQRVWVFIGDMTSYCGIVIECLRYIVNFRLPCQIIIEDNYKSVGTPTEQAWGQNGYNNYINLRKITEETEASLNEYLKYYQYNMDVPHAGCGVFIKF